ncbi:MAG: toll/interleukin-1 receptor domain-containing protein, partial [Candidatus Hodarchaeota archaeon]
MEMATVFICYETTTGLEFAKHLQKALGKHEISSFVAKADIHFGKDPSRAIRQNLEECRFFVPILTITALKSSEVRKEFLLAKKLEKYLIPCVKEGLEDYVEKGFKEIL